VDQERIAEMVRRLELLRQEAEALSRGADDFPAMRCNAARLLACVRMMEINLGQTGLTQPPQGA
jgi:hypothetical protein